MFKRKKRNIDPNKKSSSEDQSNSIALRKLRTKELITLVEKYNELKPNFTLEQLQSEIKRREEKRKQIKTKMPSTTNESNTSTSNEETTRNQENIDSQNAENNRSIRALENFNTAIASLRIATDATRGEARTQVHRALEQLLQATSDQTQNSNVIRQNDLGLRLSSLNERDFSRINVLDTYKYVEKIFQAAEMFKGLFVRNSSYLNAMHRDINIAPLVYAISKCLCKKQSVDIWYLAEVRMADFSQSQ